MSSSYTCLFYSFVRSHELFKVEVREKKTTKTINKKKKQTKEKKLIKKISGSIQVGLIFLRPFKIESVWFEP
jgi:hypothetical protein